MMKKRQIELITNGDDNNGDKTYRFQVLLPNGISVQLIMRNPSQDMDLKVFMEKVKEKSLEVLRQTEPSNQKRKVLWTSRDLYLEDCLGNKMKGKICFDSFKPNKIHYLRLFDGAGETVDTFENMWDLTPDTDLLTELPDDYTFETALADLIDNSLQAVWSNGKRERKLISVEINENRVSIFDTGPGMDGSEENSIVKWGKMGASLHRSSKRLAIGGEPPFLTPFFGMFGYGGTIASMHLGRHAVVSAKTKQSEKVYWLRLERDALLKRSGSNLNWKAAGGIREPLDVEIEKSPHGSFTKVDMKPKLKLPDIFQLQCKLKDIYFPYIQYDEISKAGRTRTLVEFRVNGVNLAEIDGGEVAITNLHSCNGPDFDIDLRFCLEKDKAAAKSPSIKASCEANARLKCVYFPIIKGKENIQGILEKLKADGCEIKEDYGTFSRVSIRRLGRLLPDARWEPLPFMKPRQKRGDKVQILKRCCLRVKCFIDTDAGFYPIPSKTDLQLHHPFTKTLKDLGIDPSEKEREVKVEIFRDRKQLTLSQLEKEYQDWIIKMHNQYDEEFNCGEDEPVLLVNASNKAALGIKSDVVRVHRSISRKGRSWSSGQKIKILKGACAGCHKQNIYATLEFFLLEGFQGDMGGEARVICRPLGVQVQDGCVLTVDANSTHLELHSSLSLPIIVIDSGKCIAVDDDDWNCQVEKVNMKMPSTIEVLNWKQCKKLDITRAFPIGATVSAGCIPPKEVVAVIRPANFKSNNPNDLDQKYIMRDNYEMWMEIKYKGEAEKSCKLDPIFSASSTSTSRGGCQGLYVFSLGSVPRLFQKAGDYLFSFSLKEPACISREISVRVKASSKIERWELLEGDQNLQFNVSAGSCFPSFSVACYDVHDNRVPFKSIPEILFQLMSNGVLISAINNVKLELSSDNSYLIVRNVRITTNNLDKIRPSYEATLALSHPDNLPILSIPCRVVPGLLRSVTFHFSNSGNGLLPKQVVEDIKLELFDRHNNHIKEGIEVELALHGFCFLDQIGLKRKVDDLGYIDLSGLLKVTGGYGKPVSISVLSNKEVVGLKKFQVEKRELRIATEVPERCLAGSKLKEIAFEVVNSQGEVDKTIHDEDKHGQSHTLRIRTDFPDFDDSLRYAFRHGHCVIPSLSLPPKEGSFCIDAVHSHHPELLLKFKITVAQATYAEEPIPSSPQASEEEHDDDVSQSSEVNISPRPASFAAKHVVTMKALEQQDLEAIISPPLYQKYDVITPVKYTKEEHEEHPDSFASKNLTTSTGSNFRKKQANLAQTPTKQRDPNDEHNNDMFRSPEGKIVSADLFTPECVTTLMGSDLQEFQDVEKEMFKYGSLIKEHEEDLKWLEGNKDAIEGDLLQLQGCVSQKDDVSQKIENKVESAAGVYSIVTRNIAAKELHPLVMANTVGLVALLGTAPSHMLSCLLAEYLGEDQMLALVCQSSAIVTLPEEYENELNTLAARMGKCIQGSHLLIFLEDIRAYAGGFLASDPQRRLALPKPILPNGKTPHGFLGYAVNMIDVCVNHLRIRTSAGHGLRETLFYRLFGELQVYESKEYMKQAYGCMRDGAISMDGGMIRGNGVISLGCKQPDIYFPVIARERDLIVSQQKTDIMKQIEEKKEELKVTKDAIEYSTTSKNRCLKAFQESKAKYLKLVEDKESQNSYHNNP